MAVALPSITFHFLLLAIQAFRRQDNCGLVLAIQRMMNIEEKQLLYGYVSMFLGEFDRAQEFFLASSKPVAALEVSPKLSRHHQSS